MTNHLVRVYRLNGIITEWEIKDRTEHEASREAEADIARMEDVEDWSMTTVETKDKNSA